MAFNTEIQSSQSRPQTNNNNHKQIIENRSIRRGTTETGAYDYDNNKFRTVGKHNIDDPGTTTTRSYRNSNDKFNEYNSKQFKSEPIIEYEESKQQQESENTIENSTTKKFETKNIFAYQACEISTGSARNSNSSTPPPEQFEFVTTPPPSNYKSSDPGVKSEKQQYENNKNTLFTKVSTENVFSENQYKPSAKERSERITKPSASKYRIFDNTSEYQSIVSSLFSGDQQRSVANTANKRQEYKNCEKYSELFEFVREQKQNHTNTSPSPRASTNTETIDIGINGRHRVDRCRYVPFTSGYEWSNAAYCYS